MVDSLNTTNADRDSGHGPHSSSFAARSRSMMVREIETHPIEPAWLLSRQRLPLPAVFAWRTPQGHSLLAFGEVTRLTASGPDRFDKLSRRCAHLLEQVGGDRAAAQLRLFGGFSFSDELPEDSQWHAFGSANFVLPRIVVETNGATTTLTAFGWCDGGTHTAIAGELDNELALWRQLLESTGPAPPLMPSTGVARDESGGWYRASVARAVAALCNESNTLSKVVLARPVQVDAESLPNSVGAILSRLDSEQPGCVQFMVRPNADDAVCPVFVGATPEWLVRKKGQHAEIDALAGTAPADQGALLLASKKDAREHQFVVDAVVSAIAPLSSAIEIAGSPELRRLRDVVHLWSPVRARLDRNPSVLDLVKRLHPTPAVCGSPRSQAKAVIDEFEGAAGFERGWYAGGVGWFDLQGDGEIAVALRSGLLDENGATLFAGAGIVAASDPDSELRETRLKLRAVQRALGLGGKL